MNIPIDNQPSSIATDDESDVGIRRQFRTMKARLLELERLYSSRFQYQVPTTTILQRESLVGSKCKFHLHVKVSMHSAIVECADCKAPLDALQVLREFARDERHFADQLEHLRQEKADLHKEIEALKKQKQNLRNAVRKAGGKPIERWQLKDAPSDGNEAG